MLLGSDILFYTIVVLIIGPIIPMIIYSLQPEWCEKLVAGEYGKAKNKNNHNISADEIAKSFRYIPLNQEDEVLESPVPNKAKAELAIQSIYKRDGLPAPLIIWTKSPLANVFAKAMIDYLSEKDLKIPRGFRYRELRANDSIRAGAWQSICEAGWKIGDRGTGSKAWNDVTLYQDQDDINWGHIPRSLTYPSAKPNGLRNMRQDNAWFFIGDVVANRSIIDWLVELWARHKIAIKSPDTGKYETGGPPRYLGEDREKYKFRHQKNLSCLSDVIADSEGRWAYPTDMYDEFKTLREVVGWVMPYRNICFVSERHIQIKLDDRERLHCETGPAFTCSDGFSIYAWHGTRFPAAWVKKKPTAREALSWRNIEQRRVACEMIGWDLILRELNSVRIDQDEDPETGELVSVDIPGIGSEKFLRVRCGTGRDFAMPVPPEMTTALQANAWTWGLKPEQYKPEVRT